ncbi:MAG TPA: alpha-1,4-glucan--maltose-1-phosphate maltosyltransferase [Dehalococcoidia bacterium]|nr:alpha-1,4-glucan--maltose-1-phosphate maltosyltransferase [Dehalococcoidia bacterium]
MRPQETRHHVIIERVQPEIDGGRFPIKRTLGEWVSVETDIFTYGHAELSCTLLYRKANGPRWQEKPMRPMGNDRWQAGFPVEELGKYEYTVQASVDRFKSWRRDLEKRVAARQDISVDLLIGAGLVREASSRASGRDSARLDTIAGVLADGKRAGNQADLALSQELMLLMSKYQDQRHVAVYEKVLEVAVDREKARFSSWYEMFPRSATEVPGKHGTFQDCERRLTYIAEMGFDVLYLPPIHPIGQTHRKGKNNAPTSRQGDPGSPWAIGGKEGGHTAIHPELGTLEDFQNLIASAKKHGIELALDLAFQCSPDHPWVKEHPGWFRWRPDGTVQYAENPPKKYEDIYPVEFENEEWWQLWQELRRVVFFWLEQGVRIFRVDNPHTKPFAFWQWLIEDVKQAYPEVIFLSEAFTRPKIMYYLAKLGFTQSYNYFPWRNTKWEITEYFRELTQTEVREYFRPNLWPNTPDILTEYLQSGGRPAFIIRLVLAATLGASYGIYGPPFELCESQPREPGSEEYRNSEKYEIRHWELDRPDSLREIIARVNQARRANPALQSNDSLLFHQTDNDYLLCYSKQSDDRQNLVLVVVNLDPHHTHAGWVDLDLEKLGLATDQAFQVHDLLTDARYFWTGRHNYVELNPHTSPAHIFVVRRQLRREQDFEYFL